MMLSANEAAMLPGVVGVDGGEEAGADVEEGAGRVPRLALAERLRQLQLHARVRQRSVGRYPGHVTHGDITY